MPIVMNMTKLKRNIPVEKLPPRKVYVCNGCGHEYDLLSGDPDNGIAPGTSFQSLPAEWACPHCGEPKENFIEIEV